MALVNGFDPGAWGIDGARHRGELLRVVAYAGTGGNEGIVEAPDCKVHQLTVAGPQVAIDAGAVVIRNRSSSTRNQSYVVNNRIESRVDVAPTGGSVRSDLVIVRVKDPQYSPWGALSGADTQYVEPIVIQNVPSTTTTALSLNLGYSAVELARIDLPANQAAPNVVAGWIKDLRKLAQPRRASFFQRYDSPDPSLQDTNVAPDVWTRFPPLVQIPNHSMFIPSWCTSATIRARVTGVQVRTAALAGWFRYKVTANGTTIYTPITYLNEQAFNGSRMSYEISGELAVPTAMRGQTATCNIEWLERGGTGFLRTEGDTQVVIDNTWLEVPE